MTMSSEVSHIITTSSLAVQLSQTLHRILTSNYLCSIQCLTHQVTQLLCCLDDWAITETSLTHTV